MIEREQYPVEGNRKVRIPIRGAEIRALEDAAMHIDGYESLSYGRRPQVAKHLMEIARRYRAFDHGGT